MGDVDHGDVELLVDLLELASQFPFQVRVDHRQRFVEEDRRNVVADQTPAHRDFLFFVSGEVARLLAQEVLQVEDFGDFLHLAVHFRLGHALIAQREGQVVEHRHGVVDHRELKNLSNVALLRGQVVDRFAVEQHMALGRAEQPGNDVEQGRFATARWAKQRVGATLLPDVVHLADRVVLRSRRSLGVAVGEVLQTDFGHQATLVTRRPGAWTSRPCVSNTNSLWVGM
ncbi:hypothetical protein D3C76_453130 [compost metagenome]